MTRLVAGKLVFSMAIALSVFCFTFATRAQEHPAIQNHPTKAKPPEEITDKQISAFVKAYVAEREIRRTSDSAVKKAQNEDEAKKIQQEADAKIAEALEKQGLDSQTYNRIFWTVRANKELRTKVLGLVEKERNRP